MTAIGAERKAILRSAASGFCPGADLHERAKNRL